MYDLMSGTIELSDERTITMRCKAFSCESVRLHKIAVDQDGTVRVWDSVAGYYTTCHSMSRAAIAKARKLAR